MMRDDRHGRSGPVLGVVAGCAAFAASWLLIPALTGATGLGLVWGVFIGLVAFEISRHSFKLAILTVFLSLLIVLLSGIYSFIF